MKSYILCFLTLAGCSLQASAPASSSSSTSDSNKDLDESLNIALYMDNNEETTANITQLLDKGARFEGDPLLFSTSANSYPRYADKPKIMQALINHPSTVKNSILWHNLQATFIRAEMNDLKELAVNPKFDINYSSGGQDALSNKVGFDVEPNDLKTAYDRARFLRVMDMREMNNARNKARATIDELEYCSDTVTVHFIEVRNSAQGVLNALDPQVNVYSLPNNSIMRSRFDQRTEYNLIKIKRELGGQNVLSFLKNREIGAPFAKTQLKENKKGLR